MMSTPRDKSYLLVNADDFGLHADINRGIAECVDRGRVQSVSFSAIGRAMDWKKLQEWSRHGVFVGLHVTLVGEPWVTDGRILHSWRDLAAQLLLRPRAIREDVNREMRRQFQLCADNGIDPHTLSHVDSHQHVHVLSGVWQPCIALASEYGIPRIRVPWCPSLKVMKKNLGGIVLQAISRHHANEVNAPLACLGLAHAGCNTVATFSYELNCAARAVGNFHSHGVELVVHPGVNSLDLESQYGDWRFDWTREREALLSPQFAESVAANGYAFANPGTREIRSGSN
jgi:chitin disaccharide deacetylase